MGLIRGIGAYDDPAKREQMHLLGDVAPPEPKLTGTQQKKDYLETIKTNLMVQSVKGVPNGVWVGLGIGAVVGVITVASLKK